MTRKLIPSDKPDDSKRMYDKRFREWKVFKNMNSDQKSKLLKRYTEAGGSPAAVERDAISQEDLRKTLRWARGLPEGMAMRRSRASTSMSMSMSMSMSVSSMSASPPASSPPPMSPTSSHGRPSGIPISELVQAGDASMARRSAVSAISAVSAVSGASGALGVAGLGLPRLHIDTGASHSPSPVPYSASSDDSYRDARDSMATPASTTTTITTCGRADPLPGIASLQLGKSEVGKSEVGKPEVGKSESPLLPSLSPGSSERTLDNITRSLRDYFDWQLERIPPGESLDAYLGISSSPESDHFWGDIKNGIYILKISPICTESLPRAFPALAAAGALAAPALATQPFDFVRNVLAVLSPANTRGHPEVRPILLRLLEREAVHTLGSERHPVATLCRELQNDDGCQEVSRRALQFLLDVFNERVGRDGDASSSRVASFKLLDSLATLLRRGGEYDAALEIVVALLTSCRAVFGAGSDQARTVENELAHFYMAADQHDLALQHCMHVVRRPAGSDSVYHHDSIAAHTMEDIADIHVRRGNIEHGLVWLARARTIAIDTWGLMALATKHIIDKMTSLQRQFGRDLLQEATRWEAAIAT